MNITIYTNKIKKKFIINANNEYLKRLSKYCKITIKEVKDYKKELSQINDQAQIYTINVNNLENTITSLQLATSINKLAVSGNSKVFIFLNAEHNFNFNNTLTISKMNIEQELLCTILLEQIYRGYKIMNNEAYHK